MRNLLFFVASTIVVLASCSPSSQTPLTNDEREAINEAIVERMNSYVAAIETLDSNVVDDFYVKGPDFRVISDGQL